VRDRPRFQGGRHQYERRTAQTHIYIGLPGADAQDEDRFAHEVVNTVLGGGMSSRLFRLIREERGLAYAVSSSAMHYSDAGLWLIYAGVAPHNTEETIAIVLAQLDHLQREGITHDELALAKAKLRGNLILDLETNSNRMARLGSAAVTTREILSPDALIARLDAVTEEDAMRVIARFSQAERVNLAVIGPPEKGSTHKSSLVSSQSLR
jgi:predicted Zn-dependent peptidase